MSTPVTLTTGSLIFNCPQHCNSPRLFTGSRWSSFPSQAGRGTRGARGTGSGSPRTSATGRGSGLASPGPSAETGTTLRVSARHWHLTRHRDHSAWHGTQSCYWSFQAISAASWGHIWETINLHIPHPDWFHPSPLPFSDTKLLSVWRKFMVLQILNATWDQPQAVIYLGSCQLPVLMFLWINYLTQRSVWLHANPNDMRPTMEDWGAHGNFFMANIIY